MVVPLSLAAGAITLGSFAVLPLTGLLPGGATAALLVLGLLFGLLVLSARDACSVLTWLVVLLFLVPQPFVLVGPLKSVGNPAGLVALGALAIWAASRVLGLIEAPELHPVRWTLLGFSVAALASYGAGLTRDLTAGEAASMDRVVFQHLALLGIGLLAVDGLGSRERITTLLQRLVMVGGLAAFIGILEFVFSAFDFRSMMLLPGLTTSAELDSYSRSGFDRIAAGASHPIEFSVVTAALVPLAMHFTIHEQSGRWKYWLALLALLSALPLSVSRSGFLTLAVGVAFYVAALTNRGRLNVLVLGVIGLGVFRAVVPGLLGTVRGLFLNADTDPSISGRTEDYAAIPGLMQDHWLIGRGTGTFVPDVYFFLDNQYLATLLQGGLVGLVVFVALHLIGLGVARGVRRRSTDPELRSLGQALAATIASLGVASFFYDSISFRQSAFLLVLAIGCAGALWTLVRDEPKRHHRDAPTGARLDHQIGR
ncbi:O-antigen ligase family protein [Nocardioides furvisabuli]|uniref:O-antigen ligase family protein n=1 Tax=Nocardioides furvisabuli TaxID=375542 RepID=UPI0031E20E93